MRRNKIWIGILCVLMVFGLVAGCSKKEKPASKPEKSKDVVLADFEEWAPDFQTLRLRNEFGSIDVNTDADYVKSGKQSAALTVVGAEGSESPWFFVNTVSTRFEYDYSDFSCIDNISAWFYNASDTEEQLHVGLITNVVSIIQSDIQKFDTFTLKPGWNEVVYQPDMNYIISAVGKDAYEGIKGIYFMFDNPHATARDNGKRFYVDDITLHYGKEKPFTEVRAGSYYASGTKIGAPRWIVLDNPIDMKDLEGKALHFEFKFDSDTGRFGFAICCNDYKWSNITGTLIIEKTKDGVFANMGRIVELEDGWYAWELNSDMFEGDGVDTAKDVSLIYHQNEVVQGNVIIDWKSMRAVDAYPVTREERSEKLTDGDLIYYHIKKGVTMAELAGKGLQFEFKFVSKTGKFGFAFMDNEHDWANVTGTLVIEKKNGKVTSNIGKIIETGDGWYAWRLDSELFAGSGVEKAKTIDLAYHDNGTHGIDTTVQGTVYIDWKSVKAVELKGTREELSDYYTDGSLIEHYYRKKGISIANLKGKALQFEFKFASEAGKFGFAFMDNEHDWANVTGTLVIEKKNGKVTSNIGKIIETGGGWYAWRLNSDQFAGSGAAKANIVDFAYHNNGIHGIDTTVQGTVYIDWKSTKVVDAYKVTREERSEELNEGGLVWHYFYDDGISMNALSGKALQFEFKFASNEGKFGFAFMDNEHDWANITGTVVIEKKDGKVTSNIGKIVETGNGWYAWKLNSDLFAGSGAAKANIVDLAYHNNGTDNIDTTIKGKVYIDWKSMKAVDAYKVTREERSEELNDGSLIWHYFYDDGVSMSDLSGKALQFEFKFASEEGRFGFAFMDDKHDWANITGTLVIEKKDGKITSNIGKIEETKDGWYAWKLNCAQFAGGGVANAKIVDLAYHDNGTHGIDTTVKGKVYIDWKSMKAVDAYSVNRDESAQKYTSATEFYKEFDQNVITKDELNGKALHLEFKFTTETGKFGFDVMDKSWVNITGNGVDKVIIEKTSNGITASMGRIIALENDWYAWELNSSDFKGDGWTNNTVAGVGLFYHQGVGVTGEVLVDWESLKVVDAYDDSGVHAKQYKTGDLISENLSKVVSLADLKDKVLQFEFKIPSETGEFRFVFTDRDNGNANISGWIWIKKANNKVTIEWDKGKIEESGNGWYKCTINDSEINGNEKGKAANINCTDDSGLPVQGEVWINWDSLKVVEPYDARDLRAKQYKAGDMVSENLSKVVTLADLKDRALQFEFKIPSETGEFRFVFTDRDNSNANISGWIWIKKVNNKVTIEWDKGKIEESGNGWYKCTINDIEINGNEKNKAANINCTDDSGLPVSGEVLIDWEGMCVVDSYSARTTLLAKLTDDNVILQRFGKAFLWASATFAKGLE